MRIAISASLTYGLVSSCATTRFVSCIFAADPGIVSLPAWYHTLTCMTLSGTVRVQGPLCPESLRAGPAFVLTSRLSTGMERIVRLARKQNLVLGSMGQMCVEMFTGFECAVALAALWLELPCFFRVFVDILLDVWTRHPQDTMASSAVSGFPELPIPIRVLECFGRPQAYPVDRILSSPAFMLIPRDTMSSSNDCSNSANMQRAQACRLYQPTRDQCNRQIGKATHLKYFSSSYLWPEAASRKSCNSPCTLGW
jgi:hypothetical protein